MAYKLDNLGKYDKNSFCGVFAFDRILVLHSIKYCYDSENLLENDLKTCFTKQCMD